MGFFQANFGVIMANSEEESLILGWNRGLCAYQYADRTGFIIFVFGFETGVGSVKRCKN